MNPYGQDYMALHHPAPSRNHVLKALAPAARFAAVLMAAFICGWLIRGGV